MAPLERCRASVFRPGRHARPPWSGPRNNTPPHWHRTSHQNNEPAARLYFLTNDRAVKERPQFNTISGGVTINNCMLRVAQDDLPFG